MVPLSILDLAPITQGSDAAAALRHSLDLARHAEQWGYTRFWVAEHHNMPGIASAATAVVIAHIARGTKTIRVGAGGIMLPNHAPLIVAEQFGTLESLFPGRIDLGLGRAPGTDQTTAVALRRTLASNPDLFPQDVLELMAYFQPEEGQRVRAVPGAGLTVPIYILGSSLFGAQVAAAFGLPFAFASHFARTAVCDARREHHHGGYRRRGAAARHVGTAVIREPARRHPDSAAAAEPRVGEGCRALRRHSARDAAVHLLCGVAGDRDRRHARVPGAHASGRTHRRVPRVRAHRTVAVLRAGRDPGPLTRIKDQNDDP
jgi:luciferase family oxidoreductase group 1